MNTGGVARVTRVISLVSQQCAGRYEYLVGAGRKVSDDERISLFVGHVGVVYPNLAAGLQGVIWNANNNG